jgi:catechol 2,3-dioxygenase
MPQPIHPDARIGHVHLKVSDIDRSIAFYRDVLGFEVVDDFGSAAFLSAGGYHHHIGLNTWDSHRGTPPSGHTGLYHAAILYPTRKELAKAVQRLLDHHYPIVGTADHGVSEAIYLEDPDGNGLELYWDRPREAWPRQNGKIAMVTEPLDLDDLLSEVHHRPHFE